MLHAELGTPNRRLGACLNFASLASSMHNAEFGVSSRAGCASGKFASSAASMCHTELGTALRVLSARRDLTQLDPLVRAGAGGR